MKSGDSILMMSDEFPGNSASPTSLGNSTVNMHIYSRDVDKLWERAVGAGARIVMPIDNQFWGERYGKLVDSFGHTWSLSMQVSMTRSVNPNDRLLRTYLHKGNILTNPTSPLVTFKC